MASYVDMYNDLPSITEADKRFTDRSATFAKLAPLLSRYGHQFGVCLVHAHCVLEPGEMMVGTGDVCQPIKTNTGTNYYAERWLSNGSPYEFTTSPTFYPPADLVAEFERIVSDIGVLGLYFAGASDDNLRSERTEGRKNITSVVSEPQADDIETAWVFKGKDLLRVACRHCRRHRP